MHKTIKERLIVSGVVCAALPLLICSVAWAHSSFESFLDLHPWAHMTLEASLNVVWVLLALGAVAHWVAPVASKRRGQLAGFVSLIFVLSLLFPIISANDDLAQLDLINDAKTSQSLTTTLKSDKPLRGSGGLLCMPAVPAVQLVSFLPVASNFVSEPAPAVSVAAPGDATGNHSPPAFLT